MPGNISFPISGATIAAIFAASIPPGFTLVNRQYEPNYKHNRRININLHDFLEGAHKYWLNKSRHHTLRHPTLQRSASAAPAGRGGECLALHVTHHGELGEGTPVTTPLPKV
jgi:hypothetical protein